MPHHTMYTHLYLLPPQNKRHNAKPEEIEEVMVEEQEEEATGMMSFRLLTHHSNYVGTGLAP